MRDVSDSTVYKREAAALYQGMRIFSNYVKTVLVSYLSVIPDFYGAAQNRKTNK